MSPEEVLVKKLIEKNYKISAAESCTGGMIASRIINVSGASKVLDISFVTYADAAKVKYLGVEQKLIDKYSVVSSEVALAMAKGLIEKCDCKVAIATTGIAGPLGETAVNPVGTVYIAVIAGDNSRVSRYIFDGDRANIRKSATDKAIEIACELI